LLQGALSSHLIQLQASAVQMVQASEITLLGAFASG
jgi:hypothetical protein